MKNRSANTLALAAAFAGLLGGTTARLNAQPSQQGSTPTANSSANAGTLLAADGVDGLLVGGASLTVDSWMGVVGSGWETIAPCP